MFSLSYQIEKAFDIASKEPDARIGVFCNWMHAKPIIDAVMRDTAVGIFKQNTRTFTSETGSVVMFFQAISLDDLYERICGAQFSHVFARDVNYDMQSYLRSRLRSTKSFVEPMGYYDEFGAIRYEVY